MSITDCLIYQQGLITLLCWQQIWTFQLILFWYKIPPIFVWQTKNYKQIFSNEASNSVAFFLWILARASKLWVLVLKIYWFFCFLHITSFREMIQVLIFRYLKFMNLWTCQPNFLVRDHLWRILLGFKFGTITGFPD